MLYLKFEQNVVFLGRLQTVTLFPRVGPDTDLEGVAMRYVTSKINRQQLACSTLYPGSDQECEKFGFLVQYKVVVKLYVDATPLDKDVVGQLPIYLVARRRLMAGSEDDIYVGNWKQANAVTTGSANTSLFTDVNLEGYQHSFLVYSSISLFYVVW